MSVNDLVSTDVKPWMNIVVNSINVQKGPYPYENFQCFSGELTTTLTGGSTTTGSFKLKLNRVGNSCYITIPALSLTVAGSPTYLEFNTPIPEPFFIDDSSNPQLFSYYVQGGVNHLSFYKFNVVSGVAKLRIYDSTLSAFANVATSILQPQTFTYNL